jgi:hypothetical protein
MEFMDEPEGWRELQEMAQREEDPKVLASIIDKMNRLLDRHERIAAKQTHDPAPCKKNSDPKIKLQVQTWRLAS